MEDIEKPIKTTFSTVLTFSLIITYSFSCLPVPHNRQYRTIFIPYSFSFFSLLTAPTKPYYGSLSITLNATGGSMYPFIAEFREDLPKATIYRVALFTANTLRGAKAKATRLLPVVAATASITLYECIDGEYTPVTSQTFYGWD